jgi:hypothetical protein
VKEVIKEYKIGIKKAILNYSKMILNNDRLVLLEEKERKRLRITYIPKMFPSSSQMILSEGGYNRKIYMEWHNNVSKTRFECQIKLSSVYTPIQRALIDWFD